MELFQGNEWSYLRELPGWIPLENILLHLNSVFWQSAMVHSLGRRPSINHILQSVKRWMFGMLLWDSLANLHAKELLHVPWQLPSDKERKISSQQGPSGTSEAQMVLWSLWSYREKLSANFHKPEIHSKKIWNISVTSSCQSVKDSDLSLKPAKHVRGNLKGKHKATSGLWTGAHSTKKGNHMVLSAFWP